MTRAENTVDVVLHTILSLVVAAIAWALFAALPQFIAAGVTGYVFGCYFREVTQRQYSKQLSFTDGWLPWRWHSSDGTLNMQKIVETIVPAPLVMAFAGLLTRWLG